MGNRTFPRWAGPVVGLWAGAYIPVRQAVRGGPLTWEQVGLGAGCGLAAGLVMWLADAPPADPPRVSTVGGELLAAVGWVVVLVPGVNLLVNGAAALVNRGVQDWPGKWSRVGLGSAALFFGLLAG